MKPKSLWVINIMQLSCISFTLHKNYLSRKFVFFEALLPYVLSDPYIEGET